MVDHERDQKWILYPDPGVADSRTVIYSSHDKDIEVLISGQGIWYLQLSGADDHWRLRTRITTPIQQLVLHSQ